jgi:hypothetical protein
MHSTIFTLSALAGLAACLPQPQAINFAAVAAAPAPTVTGPPIFATSNQTSVYNSPSAASSAAASANATSLNQKRAASVDITAPCAPQPNLNGPTAWPNTVFGFENSPIFASVALYAAAPSGYTRSFANYNGSMTGAGYLGYYSLSSYNVQTCASYCNSVATCLSFNVFYERDPTLNPADACPNPTAGTAIKCSLWGVPASKASASNMGQYRDQFQVVIAGSDGYTLTNPVAASVPSFNAADVLAGAINNAATYIGSEYYNQPYDPSVCAAVCQATTAKNMAVALAQGGGSYTPCNYYNSFVLSQNGAATGMYCAFHSAAVPASAAGAAGVSNGGVSFAFSNSLGYALGKQDAGVC